MLSHRVAMLGRAQTIRTVAAQPIRIHLHASHCPIHTLTPCSASSIFRSRSSHPSDILPIVQLKVEPKLMQEVTREILEEHAASKGKKRTTAATSTKIPSKDDAKSSNSKKTVKSKRAATDTAESSITSAKRSSRSTTATAGASSAAASSATTSSASRSASATAASKTTPTALDDQGWEEWTDMAKPFEDKGEEQEFLKWQRILEEEEKRVDQEMEEEAASKENQTKDSEEIISEAEKVEAIEEEQGEIDEEAAEALDAEEEDKEFDDEVNAPEPDSSPPAVRSAAATPPPPPVRIRRSKGIVEDGVRTRMLNMGGEQVMELTGVDEDDPNDACEIDENGNLIEQEEEWSEDVDLSVLEPIDMNDPETEVGKGVGGVSFTRKELMDLSEDDLIETFTKGSGRGGQKVNKTNSCVQLLHLPTGYTCKMSILS
jgi:hypothetical protein